ncbi:hypothetical protein C8T65DRAFT_685789 [Cerioporus squamosus]|nr:hypothetical protein C8T65DRAFT_685789 [Cerioporus squamosus]
MNDHAATPAHVHERSNTYVATHTSSTGRCRCPLDVAARRADRVALQNQPDVRRCLPDHQGSLSLASSGKGARALLALCIRVVADTSLTSSAAKTTLALATAPGGPRQTSCLRSRDTGRIAVFKPGAHFATAGERYLELGAKPVHRGRMLVLRATPPASEHGQTRSRDVPAGCEHRGHLSTAQRLRYPCSTSCCPVRADLACVFSLLGTVLRGIW